MNNLNQQQFITQFSATVERANTLKTVLSYLLVETSGDSSTRNHNHQDASVRLVSTLPGYDNQPSTIQEHLMRFEEISPQQFMGSRFNIAQEEVLLERKKKTKHDDPYAYYDKHGNVTKTLSFEESLRLTKREGFVYALVEPPFSSHDDAAQIALLVREFYSSIFNKFENTIIYQWNTDWSDYFEDGHEWWGAFMWTVELTDKNIIIAIAGSATD
jgi:hypothetical protein